MLTRIAGMLGCCDGDETVMPPTQLFNEGWLLRLALDWFAAHPEVQHELAVPQGCRWYSEALLPSPFPPRQRGDGRGESHTHADGVVGDFDIGGTGDGELVLRQGATRLVVIEAKLKSRLSSGTRNAPDYDQAARNVACLAKALTYGLRPPAEMATLAFYVVAPASQIESGVFAEQLTKESVLRKVTQRVKDYGSADLDEWLHEWFEPVLARVHIGALSWEAVGDFMLDLDPKSGDSFAAFYAKCVEFNRLATVTVGGARRSIVSPAPVSSSKLEEAPQSLADYVRRLPDFDMVEDLELPYNHMGATITDAVLQAGLRYETVVLPRVQHVMEAFSQAARTSGFLEVLRERGGEEVVHWTHPEKLGRMEAVAELFIEEGVETEADLHCWLCGDGPEDAAMCQANVAKLAKVRGMGPKTIDYFKILSGEQDTAAIDVHLMRFLAQAGVRVRDYEDARGAIAEAAASLDVSTAQLDHSIWAYMSKAGQTR